MTRQTYGQPSDDPDVLADYLHALASECLEEDDAPPLEEWAQHVP